MASSISVQDFFFLYGGWMQSSRMDWRKRLEVGGLNSTVFGDDENAGAVSN